MPWEHRASIFLKAADLLTGPWRAKMNAATMLGQSKTAFQAEIDSACELADFLRFNVAFAEQIYKQQPENSHGVWNRTEYRPLDGFVMAISPFNFTSIGGNLCTAPAIMGRHRHPETSSDCCSFQLLLHAADERSWTARRRYQLCSMPRF